MATAPVLLICSRCAFGCSAAVLPIAGAADFDEEDTMTEIDAPALIPQEHVLLHELNHRINNEFAAAIGIATVAAARSGNEEVKAALTWRCRAPPPLCGRPSAPADAGPRHAGRRCRVPPSALPFHQSLPAGCQGDQPRPFGPAAAAASRALLALGNDRPRAYIERSATRIREPAAEQFASRFGKTGRS